MVEKRTYKKRSDYWNKFNKSEQSLENFSLSSDFTPSLSGESYYESQASSRLSNPTSRTETRRNSISSSPTKDRFKNIYDGLLPFEYSADSVSSRDAIELCQKAYFNIAAFRTTIDLLSEFADSEIFLEGGTEKSRNFVNAWFKRIKIHDVKSQYFREYYRSGNVFFYRLDGKVKNPTSDIIESYAATTTRNAIPIKYLLLNPVDIAAKGTVTFSDFQYLKILTPYEIARLKNPTTEHEKELKESLPAEVQKKLSTGVNSTGDRLYISLDSKYLHAVFSKKQDYEPMSVPVGFSVLDDINKKMELKKIDQAIARSIENVILLVTMGTEPEKGGINHKNLAAMQEIFKNQSVGRVLVSDYTTEAEFIIPDLRKVMGKEKYEVLNRDIEEGLQNILMGESKYADTKLKLKIFMQRLDEARSLFIKEFIQPEIKRVCQAMGMRTWPQAKFVKTDTLDDEGLQKLTTRMMELGVLTPEQGMHTINTGVFPKKEELVAAQEKFLKERELGYYTPLVNSINIQQHEDMLEQQEFDNDLAEESLELQKKTAEEQAKIAKKAAAQKPAAKKTATTSGPSGGRPMGTSKAESFSRKNILAATKLMNEFEFKAFAAFAEKYGVEKLEEDKKDLVSKVCESIVVAKEIADWEASLSKVVDNFESLAELDISPDVLDIGAKHQLDDLASAILYHSTQIPV
jgi:hypothetical protein